jgi:uncharacterized protein (DUF885 family)
LLPIDQFSNIANSMAQFGSGTSAQPFVTVKDYDDWLRRAARAPVIFEQAILNMREGMKEGLVQPRVLMDKVLPQLDANITDDVEKSIFWGPVTRMPQEFSAADRERLTAAFRQSHRYATHARRTASCAPSLQTSTCRSAVTPSAVVHCRRAPPGTNTTCATTPCAP